MPLRASDESYHHIERRREREIRSRDINCIDPTFGGRYGPQFPEINKARARPLRAANEPGRRRNEFSYSCVFSFRREEQSYSGRASAKTMALVSSGHNTRLAGVFPADKTPSTCLPVSSENVFEYISVEVARETRALWRKEKQRERREARRYFGNEKLVT